MGFINFKRDKIPRLPIKMMSEFCRRRFVKNVALSILILCGGVQLESQTRLRNTHAPIDKDDYPLLEETFSLTVSG